MVHEQAEIIQLYSSSVLYIQAFEQLPALLLGHGLA